MTQIKMPSGQIIDFGDADRQQIGTAINALRTNRPDLFEEKQVEKKETIAEIYARGMGRSPKSGTTDRSSQDEKELLSEVKDKTFRFNLGRKDTDEEKLGYIQDVMGSTEAVVQDADGAFLINQELLSPEVRQEFGLGEKGFVYADKPGFSVFDLIDFAGEAGPEIAAGLGASIAVAGTGGGILPFLAAAAKVGAATAGGRAIDEAIEYGEGYNKQSFEDVATQVAVSGALGLVGEGGGRAITALGGRLFKGKGPKLSQKRIEQLEGTIVKDKKGKDVVINRKQAEKIAQEEARKQMNDIIKAGGVPSVEAAADKTLTGAIQEINELILPDRSVARRNVAFIKNQLARLEKGEISGEQARELLTDHAKALSEKISEQFVDPKDAVQNFQTKILPILEKQMKIFVDQYSPVTGLPTDFDEAAKLSAQLYTQGTRRLYSQADNILKDKVFIDADPILKKLDEIQENKFFEGEGALFNRIKQVANASYDPKTNTTTIRGPSGASSVQEGATLTKSPEGKFTLEETQQMKEALRIARGDSDLIATGEQKIVDDVIRSIDDARASKHASLASETDQIKDPLIRENLTKGLNILREANKAWADGQDIYNRAGINAIIKDAKAGKFVSNQKILDQMDNFDPRVLNQYLDAVTPPDTVKQLNLTPTKINTLEEIQQILTRADVDGEAIDQINNLLKANDLAKIGPDGKGFIVREIPEWMRGSVQADFKKAYLDDYANEISNLTQLARAGVSPDQLRTNIRESLAKKWIENTKQATVRGDDTIDPKGFATRYFRLNPAVRKELFGADNAQEMDNIISDFHLVSVEDADKLIAKLPSAFNKDIQEQLVGLSEEIKQAKIINSDALTKSLKEGRIEDPSQVAKALRDNPNSYDRLRNLVGDEVLEEPGGVKDMIMFDIFEEPLKKLSEGRGAAEDFVQTGKWGKLLKSAIERQNANGGVEKILGKDIFSDLNKLADDAIKISDSEMAGTSIAGPQKKIAVAAAIFGALLNPALALSAVGSLLPVFLASRFLRNKTVLKYLTSPRLRANEYNLFKQTGADLTEEQFGVNKLLPIANSQLGILTASGLFGEPIQEAVNPVVQDIAEETQPVTEQITEEVQNLRPQASTLNLPDTGNFAPLANQQPPTMAPDMGTGEQLLADIERRKALGLV
ncbi:MAG: hypothetical protein CMG35_10885 [Candidatus Marinimicrobia bacterium]|nr:hypothetical protein [Candidatus Neomarinimicrobiota bacterium]